MRCMSHYEQPKVLEYDTCLQCYYSTWKCLLSVKACFHRHIRILLKLLLYIQPFTTHVVLVFIKRSSKMPLLVNDNASNKF